MKPEEILLAQLPVPSLVPLECTGNIPLAAAFLKMHAGHPAERAAGSIRLLDPEIQNRGGDAAVLQDIISREPGTVGLTANVWNIERTLRLAAGLKRRRPETRVWLGGPEVAADSYFVQDSRAPFDLAVAGEGEGAFRLLASGADPDQIRGLWRPGGVRTDGPRRIPRLPRLDSVHDPFLRGLVAPEADGVMLAEFQRGCAYGCWFCAYHQGRRGRILAKTREQVAGVFSWARDHGIREIYLLDPSLEQKPDFAGFLRFLAEVNRDPAIPLFAELRIDGLDPGLAEPLYQAGIRMVETGLQTLDPAVLRKVGRRSYPEKFSAMARALRRRRIHVKADLMFGLPGQTPAEWESTLRFLRTGKLADSIQVFRTQVLPGTRLRQKAGEWNVAYEDRPPYSVLSTPAWPPESLEQGLAVAEDILRASFSPEDRPLFQPPAPDRDRMAASYSAGGPEYAYAFNLARPPGREALAAERFDRAANATSVWIQTDEPQRDTVLVENAMLGFLEQNPFSSLCLALEIPVMAPLNIFDRLEAALEQNQPSRYLERLYHPVLPYYRPQRRIFGALPAAARKTADPGWLEALRRAGEVVWRIPGEIRKAVHDASPAPEDYILLEADRERAEGPASPPHDTRQTLLAGRERHWEFLRRHGRD